MKKVENIAYKPISSQYNNKVANNKLDATLIFDNLIWMSTKEAAVYLRKSVNAIHTLVSRRKLRARKFSNRLYFKKEELDYLIETSHLKGG